MSAHLIRLGNDIETLNSQRTELEIELASLLEKEKQLKESNPALFSFEEQVTLRGGNGFVSWFFVLLFLGISFLFWLSQIQEKKVTDVWLKVAFGAISLFIGAGLFAMIVPILRPILRLFFKLLHKIPQEQIQRFIKTRKTQHFEKNQILRLLGVIRFKLKKME